MKKETIVTVSPETCAEMIRSGGLVGVPTETVYGLAANGLDERAVDEIYRVKGRPSVKPLSLMVHDAEAMSKYCEEVPPAARKLAEAFWPGPLTIVLKAKDIVPAIVRAGGETVGLRCPDHPLTLALLREAGLPLAAPSANPSGAPSPKSAEEVLAYFKEDIDAVLDGGICGIGRESTIISLAETPYRILRQGALEEEKIADALVRGMTVYGITGGSGSGKTTALRVLKDLGALVLDADRIYHELLRHDAGLLSDIERCFPGTVREGSLNRRALAAIVFRNPAALEDLNAITHPAVVREIQGLLRKHAMSGGTLAAIDAIALPESGLADLCTRSYAVIADRETRAARIMRRDGLSRAEAEHRIDAQRPDDYFVSHCSTVLYNDNSEELFMSKCKKQFLEDLSHG